MAKADKSGGKQIVVEKYFPYPVAAVWRAIATRESLSEWLMQTDFEPRVGHKFQFRAQPMRGWRGYVDCEVLEVVPNRRLVYTWQGMPEHSVTTVTYELEQEGEGTLLKATHEGFDDSHGFLSGLLVRGILKAGWRKMFRTQLPAVLARLAHQSAFQAAATADQAEATPRLWLRFLPRYSLLAGLVCLCTPLTFMIGIGANPADLASGTDIADLMQAIRAPDAYRLLMIFETLLWVAVAGTLAAISGLTARSTPRLSVLIALCSAGQLAGVLGGLFRLNAILPFSARFAASTAADKSAWIESFRQMQGIANAYSHAGSLIQGMGFLLAALALFAFRDFPRWIAVWMLLPAVAPLIQFAVVATGRPFVTPLLLLHILVGYVGLSLAMAVGLWRRT
jgi:uncharacterized protein YndB with AHSA1/START domain